MRYYIYKVTNKLNGKSYIGQHIVKNETFTRYMGKGVGIKEAIKEYGKENFVKEILEYVDDDTVERVFVSEKEKYWISKLNTMEPNGYNRHSGGYHGGGCKNEFSRLAGLKRRGLKRSEKTRKLISEARKGKKFSEEHKRHLSENHHLIKEWLFVFVDGHTEVFVGSIHKYLNSYGIKFNTFIRASYKKSFKFGFYAADIKKEDYACLQGDCKINSMLCFDPVLKETCTYKNLKQRVNKKPDLYVGVKPKDYIMKKEV